MSSPPQGQMQVQIQPRASQYEALHRPLQTPSMRCSRPMSPIWEEIPASFSHEVRTYAVVKVHRPSCLCMTLHGALSQSMSQYLALRELMAADVAHVAVGHMVIEGMCIQTSHVSWPGKCKACLPALWALKCDHLCSACAALLAAWAMHLHDALTGRTNV